MVDDSGATCDFLTSTGRDMHVSYWWKRFTSGSETNPTFSATSTSEDISAIVHVFRGVDTFKAFEGVTQVFDDNYKEASGPEIAPADIVTEYDAAAGLRVMQMTHDDVTSIGTPSGYTNGEQMMGSNDDHHQQCSAYDLDIGTAGTKSAPVFDHTVNNNVAEYRNLFVVLRNAQNIHITDPVDEERSQ